jgi:hypothetical protein
MTFLNKNKEFFTTTCYYYCLIYTFKLVSRHLKDTPHVNCSEKKTFLYNPIPLIFYMILIFGP